MYIIYIYIEIVVVITPTMMYWVCVCIYIYMLAPSKKLRFWELAMGVVGLQGFEGIADMYHPKPQDFKKVGQNCRSLGGGGVPYSYNPPKNLPFSAFCWCQRGSICWEPFAKTKLLLSKKMSTYSGHKAQHFLKEAICFKLQRSFPCLTKGNFIHKLQFSFQTKYDFVQETVPLQRYRAFL